MLSGTRVVQLPWQEKRRLLRPLIRPPREQESRPPHGSPPPDLPRQLGPYAVHDALSWSAGEGILKGEDRALGRNVWLWLRPGTEPALSPARHELNRATRLRWLAGGREDVWCWDAFLSPTGWPVADLVSDTQPLSWGEGRFLLEQLAAELVVAEADGTRPAALSTDQLWITAHGYLQLLDVPVALPAHAGARVEEKPKGSLELVREVTALALEGRARKEEEQDLPIRSPLPLYASRLLDCLTKPEASLESLQEDLSATRQQPAEVTVRRRAAHLAILAALLAIGLSAMFLGARNVSTYPFDVLEGDILATSAALRLMDDNGLRNAFIAHVKQPPPVVPELRAALKERYDRDVHERAARRRFIQYTFGPWLETRSNERATQLLLEGQLTQTRSRIDQSKRFSVVLATRRDKEERVEHVVRDYELERVLSRPDGRFDGSMSFDWDQYVATLVFVLFFPVLWIIWAFLTRGGISMRLMGMALVRADGRPAGRWRCAWRALLCWFPVAALLAASNLLEFWSWSGESYSQERVLAAWAAFLLWWASLMLLAGYFFLALRSPRRGWHDRLAGTYLVPR
jgi:hypothetical protein